MNYLSPLRYPGGKARFVPLLEVLLANAGKSLTTYAEPFAGGAGAALGLLATNAVDRVIINDIDARLAAFWRSITSNAEAFVEKINQTVVSIDSWHNQRAIMLEGSKDDLELGFAAFFLNRTNRSGILGARPIGGLKQTGAWKLDCRYDKKKMIQRIRGVAKCADRIDVRQEDASVLLDDPEFAADKVFLYLDPPYLKKSGGLYLDTLTWNDHLRLAAKLNQRESNWLLTYDCDARVVDELYPNRRYGELSLRHAAADTHVGREFVLIADSLELPTDACVSGRMINWIRRHTLRGQQG